MGVELIGAATRPPPGRTHVMPRGGESQQDAGRERPPYSALAPDEMTTFSHFAVSAAMTLPKSSGVPPIGLPPRSVKRLSIPGSTSAAFTAALILSIASRGEPFGMPSPNHAVAS